MARSNSDSGKRRLRKRSEEELPDGDGEMGLGTDGGAGSTPAPGTTGRYLVLMRQDAVEAGVRLLSDATGESVVSSLSLSDTESEGSRLPARQSVIFENLAVAVVDTPPEQMLRLGVASEDSPILAVEPERYVYAIQDDPFGDVEIPVFNPPVPERPTPDPTSPLVGASSLMASLSADYLKGYRDAVVHLVEKLLGTTDLPPSEIAEEGVDVMLTERELTWGLQVTRAGISQFTGRGIRVAVLDTGLDLTHPDFIGRAVVSQSFVPLQAVQDGHGHGTHCIGTVGGSKKPRQFPRYGVAPDVEIFAGKVLNNMGRGADQSILAGIEWAIANKCQIISMSLGAQVQLGQRFSDIFEMVAQRALAAGTLIIAAAGNESQRDRGIIEPVGHPANCPSIMAVGAVDEQLRIAPFSCGGLNRQGGKVDIAGPGVRIRSSWPQPLLYRAINGTSMATPHVAGIAALFAEANPRIRGRALAQLLIQNARPLSLPSRDVGAGLVQAP